MQQARVKVRNRQFKEAKKYPSGSRQESKTREKPKQRSKKTGKTLEIGLLNMR